MIALGIVLIIFGFITFLFSQQSFSDKKYIQAILLLIVTGIACSLGLCWIVDESKSHEQKIEFSEIKQIDTLYKNDSIIGYEIIYME